jgi:hypothetical protein
MDWKQSLDKYLTSSPNDDFSDWCEDVENRFSDTYYDYNQSWILEYDGISNKWMNKLYNKGIKPSNAAIIIERAFKLFILKYEKL